MIRNLRTLGLTVMAVLALGAVSASGAQAELAKFTAPEGYPILLKGEQLGANLMSIASGVRTISCASMILQGSLAAESAASEGITAEYGECTGNGETSATINMTGCTYTLTLTSTRPTSGTGKGKFAVSCASSTGIDIRIYSKGVEHAEGKELCRYRVPPQTLSGELEWHNRNVGTATEDIELTLTGVGVSALEVDKGTVIACGKSAPPSGTTTGSYSGNMTVTGSSGGVHKKVMIS